MQYRLRSHWGWRARTKAYRISGCRRILLRRENLPVVEARMEAWVGGWMFWRRPRRVRKAVSERGVGGAGEVGVGVGAVVAEELGPERPAVEFMRILEVARGMRDQSGLVELLMVMAGGNWIGSDCGAVMVLLSATMSGKGLSALLMPCAEKVSMGGGIGERFLGEPWDVRLVAASCCSWCAAKPTTCWLLFEAEKCAVGADERLARTCAASLSLM